MQVIVFDPCILELQKKAALARGKAATGSVKRKTRAAPKPKPVSPEFAAFLGVAETSRPQALKQVWAYAKVSNDDS